MKQDYIADERIKALQDRNQDKKKNALKGMTDDQKKLFKLKKIVDNGRLSSEIDTDLALNILYGMPKILAKVRDLGLDVVKQ